MSETDIIPAESNVPDAGPPVGAEGDVGFTKPVPTAPAPRLWGPWATIGSTVLCILVVLIAQVVAALIFVAIRIAVDPKASFDDVATNGNLWTFATLLSTPAAVGFIALLVRLRRCSIRDHLALHWPPARSVLIAFAGLAVVIFATDLTSPHD